MRRKLEKWLAPLLGYGLVALAALLVLGGIAILGGSVMRLFGFSYGSVGSILLFFLLSTLVSLPASLLARALPAALWRLGRLRLPAARALHLALDTLATAAGMWLVDAGMRSVAASVPAVLAVAFFLALPCWRDLGGSAGSDS